jgi:hypothetical protein
MKISSGIQRCVVPRRSLRLHGLSVNQASTACFPLKAAFLLGLLFSSERGGNAFSQLRFSFRTPYPEPAASNQLSATTYFNIHLNTFYRVLTMVYNTQTYWLFGLHPSSGILKTQKNTTFRKVDLFLSSGEGWETRTLFCPLERANLSISTAIL